ncbi:MAG: hypothetical protein IPL46_33760 [Saprospiraceae bacterium]|nr:hypothetical protein [Saprospiraceae bacterium]
MRRENAQLKFDLEQLRKAVYGSKSGAIYNRIARSSEFVWRSANGDPRPVDEVELVVRKKAKRRTTGSEKISESPEEVIVINPDVDTMQHGQDWRGDQ